MTRAVHVPYTVEQDGDGVWCAHAQLRPGVGANGEGATSSDAVADLREALVELGFDAAPFWVLEHNHRARRFYQAGGWSTDGATKVDDSPGFPIAEIRYYRPLK